MDTPIKPAQLIITLEEGRVSAIMSDGSTPLEVGIINYHPGKGWEGEDLVSIPQTNGNPDVPAEGYLVRPDPNPERVTQLRKAIFRANCCGYNTTEH